MGANPAVDLLGIAAGIDLALPRLAHLPFPTPSGAPGYSSCTHRPHLLLLRRRIPAPPVRTQAAPAGYARNHVPFVRRREAAALTRRAAPCGCGCGCGCGYSLERRSDWSGHGVLSGPLPKTACGPTVGCRPPAHQGSDPCYFRLHYKHDSVSLGQLPASAPELVHICPRTRAGPHLFHDDFRTHALDR
jgi:hypothetical protein